MNRNVKGAVFVQSLSFFSINLFIASAFTGCISRPKLDADRASICVSETFAFAEATRGVANPIRTVVEGKNKDFIEVAVFEISFDSFHRLGTFRVGRDRRIWRQDRITADWRLIGMCD